MRRVERRDRRCHQRHLVAKARAERAVVGFYLVGAKLIGVVNEAQRLNVQLVLNNSRQLLDRFALRACGNDDRFAQRLAQLDLRLAARRKAEPHRLARRRHRRLKAKVARRARLRPIAEMNRRLAAVEVVVDLIGDERREWGEQL